jgi:CrcB protein
MVYFVIFLGGGIGSLCRFALSLLVSRSGVGINFPWPTLAVNLLGALVIGIIVELFAIKYSDHETWRYFLVTGILGGFTTFSAFSLESALMWMRGDYAAFLFYVTASVVGTILLVLLAMAGVRIFV